MSGEKRSLGQFGERIAAARITAAAEAYCQERSDLPEERRIDVITIDLSPEGRVLRVDHIENAFAGDELPSLPSR